MAKSKNSSQHNQWRKAHRNPTKKPKTSRYPSLKGCDPKFRRNHRHALHGTEKALVRAPNLPGSGAVLADSLQQREAKEGKRETV
ncbi:60S ribosomal protein L29 [Purpureocillium lilacinum]|uniref:60S ribosomal protein L29 n=1 Tax=Purpureocillium lilacinum TaxID=33203 RepID=UPI00208D4E6C|nr:60S ribosomal protein L29 [Purpureocillium lilacinum]